MDSLWNALNFTAHWGKVFFLFCNVLFAPEKVSVYIQQLDLMCFLLFKHELLETTVKEMISTVFMFM